MRDRKKPNSASHPSGDLPPELGAQPNGGVVLLCGARTRAGNPCRGKRVSGGKRCRMHGGHCTETNAGPANGNWRGGISKPRYDGPPFAKRRHS